MRLMKKHRAETVLRLITSRPETISYGAALRKQMQRSRTVGVAVYKHFEIMRWKLHS